MRDDVRKPAAEGTSIEINQEVIALDDFCALANRLVEQGLYDEAISLYQTASKLFPDNLAVKLNLGRVQELQRRNVAERQRMFQENLAKTRAREDLLAQQYLSLATLYYSRRKVMNSIELLELSKYKNENMVMT